MDSEATHADPNTWTMVLRGVQSDAGELLNRRPVLRAGRLTRPEGKLTLTMSGNREVRDDVLRYLRAAHAA